MTIFFFFFVLTSNLKHWLKDNLHIHVLICTNKLCLYWETYLISTNHFPVPAFLPVAMITPSGHWLIPYQTVGEKTCLWGFRPGSTQAGLYPHRRWLQRVKISDSRRVIVLHYMSRDVRKPVFGVFDQVRHKPGWEITEDSQRLEISDLDRRGIVLSK